jgi:hypothetical protein
VQHDDAGMGLIAMVRGLNFDGWKQAHWREILISKAKDSEDTPLSGAILGFSLAKF